VVTVRSEFTVLPEEVPVPELGANVAVGPVGSPVALRLTVHVPLPLKSTLTELLAVVPKVVEVPAGTGVIFCDPSNVTPESDVLSVNVVYAWETLPEAVR